MSKHIRAIATDHALDNAVDRLKLRRQDAENILNQRLRNSEYIGDRTDDSGNVVKAYYHEKSRSEIRVSTDDRTIVTCMLKLNRPVSPTLSTMLPDPLLAAVKREASKLLRGHSSQLRKLEREVAEAEVELAQKRLNRIKTNNPRTKLAIDRDIAVISGLISDSKADMDAVNADISQLTPHASI